MRVRPVRAGAANWLGSGGQGRRLGARHLGRRPTQDEDVDALEAIKLDERLDQGAGCGLPSSTQRSDHELADQLDAVIAASLADAPSTRESLPQTKWYKESQVQYIGDCDAQYAVTGSGMSAARRLAAAAFGLLQ